MPGTPQRDQPFHEKDGRGPKPSPNDPARVDAKDQKPGETLADKVRRLRGSGSDERLPDRDEHGEPHHH